MYGTFQDAENYVSFYTKEHNLGNYIQLIKDAKSAVDIPVIASINCISDSEWTDYAKRIEEAGADGLEINMFVMPSNAGISGSYIEKLYFKVVENIKKNVNIPVALKLSSYFSGLANTFVDLSTKGIAAMVLFNRFYTPDIDLDTEKIISSNIYSVPEENGNTLRWISMLSGKVKCDLAASTGVHDGDSLIKNILAGANAVQIASVLYEKDLSYIKTMLSRLEEWMISKKYESVSQITGKLSAKNISNPMMYERAQFMKYFSNHY